MKTPVGLWTWVILLGGVAISAFADGEAPKARPELGNQTHRNMQSLWRTSLKPPDEKAGRDRLRQASIELNSIQFHGAKLTPKPVVTATTAPAPLPASPPTAKPSVPVLVLMKLKKAPSEAITDQTVLGDALFQGEYFEAAYNIYSQAMEKKDDPAEKAWLRFQMANCRKSSDPSAAVVLYEKLLAEHPDSPWASVASAQENLLRWREAESPAELLRSVQIQMKRLTPAPQDLSTRKETQTKPLGGSTGQQGTVGIRK